MAAARTFSQGSLPAPSSGDQDLNLAAVFGAEAESDRTAPSLAWRMRTAGFSNAMVTAVPHQMDKRVFQFFQNALVDLNVCASE